MAIEKPNVKMTFAKNLYRDNSIYNFTQKSTSETALHLAGISFAAPLAPKDWCKIGVNNELFLRLDKVIAEYFETKVLPLLKQQLFIYLQTHYQHPNRISDYLKLWGYLRERCQLDLLGLELINEVELARDEDICFAGIISVESGYFPKVVEILRAHAGFALLSNRDEITCKQNLDIFSAATYDTDYTINWQRIAEYACPLGDIVIRVPPILDIPPQAYESAIDLFLLPCYLKQVRNGNIGT